MPRSVSASFPGTAQEKRIFHRFQVVTVPAFTGGSESGFWETLVLKAGQQETVVRNAIIALGTLHEDYEHRKGRYSQALIADSSHQHALQLYGKALRQLNERLYEGNREGAKLAIISSILFACFEVLRRNNMAAVIHYQAGMRELYRQINYTERENISPTSPVSPTGHPEFRPIPQSELDELLRVFARYDIQACTFSKPRAEGLAVELPPIPPTFMNLAEVKRHLDNLLVSVYQFVKSGLGMYRYWKADEVPEFWITSKNQGVETFEGWLTAIENYFNNTQIRFRPNEVKSLLGLRMQIKIGIMMLKTCIDHGPETSFDIFENEFDDIVTQTEKCADSLSYVEGLPLDNNGTPFTMELGIIHPLFFVACKCRNWSIRTRAITCLRRTGREGVWEGPIISILAERIVAIEQQGLSPGDFIPERNRIHEIKKNVDYEGNQILMEATRATDDSYKNWEAIREMIPF